MHAKVRAKVEEPVDISGEDELTPEKIALYVDTLASIKGGVCGVIWDVYWKRLTRGCLFRRSSDRLRFLLPEVQADCP